MGESRRPLRYERGPFRNMRSDSSTWLKAAVAQLQHQLRSKLDYHDKSCSNSASGNPERGFFEATLPRQLVERDKRQPVRGQSSPLVDHRSGDLVWLLRPRAGVARRNASRSEVGLDQL